MQSDRTQQQQQQQQYSPSPSSRPITSPNVVPQHNMTNGPVTPPSADTQADVGFSQQQQQGGSGREGQTHAAAPYYHPSHQGGTNGGGVGWTPQHQDGYQHQPQQYPPPPQHVRGHSGQQQQHGYMNGPPPPQQYQHHGPPPPQPYPQPYGYDAPPPHMHPHSQPHPSHPHMQGPVPPHMDMMHAPYPHHPHPQQQMQMHAASYDPKEQHQHQHQRKNSFSLLSSPPPNGMSPDPLMYGGGGPPGPQQQQQQQQGGPGSPTDPNLAIYGDALYKTELCKSFSDSGYCRYGLKCRFAHGLQDLRIVQRHKKYKTERCKNFSRDGSCPYGPRCRFIHNTTTQDSDELPGLGVVANPSNVRGLGVVTMMGQPGQGQMQQQQQQQGGMNDEMDGANNSHSAGIMYKQQRANSISGGGNNNGQDPQSRSLMSLPPQGQSQSHRPSLIHNGAHEMQGGPMVFPSSSPPSAPHDSRSLPPQGGGSGALLIRARTTGDDDSYTYKNGNNNSRNGGGSNGAPTRENSVSGAGAGQIIQQNYSHSNSLHHLPVHSPTSSNGEDSYNGAGWDDAVSLTSLSIHSARIGASRQHHNDTAIFEALSAPHLSTRARAGSVPIPRSPQSVSNPDDPLLDTTLMHDRLIRAGTRSPVIGPGNTPKVTPAMSGVPGSNVTATTQGVPSSPFFLPGLALGQNSAASPFFRSAVATNLNVTAATGIDSNGGVGGSTNGTVDDDVDREVFESSQRQRSGSSLLRSQDDPVVDSSSFRPISNSHSPPIGPTRGISAGNTNVMHVLQLPSAVGVGAGVGVGSAASEVHRRSPLHGALAIPSSSNDAAEGESSLFASPLMGSASPSRSLLALGTKQIEGLSLGPSAVPLPQ